MLHQEINQLRRRAGTLFALGCAGVAFSGQEGAGFTASCTPNC